MKQIQRSALMRAQALVLGELLAQMIQRCDMQSADKTFQISSVHFTSMSKYYVEYVCFVDECVVLALPPTVD